MYCYRVAGTVGIMTLPVRLGLLGPRLPAVLCLALTPRLGFDPMQNFTEELQERCFRKGIPRIT